MNNKRVGYKRIANVISILFSAYAILSCLFIYLFEIDGFKQGSDEAYFLLPFSLVSAVIGYFLPQLIYKMGCYIADGFKPAE
ncbi:hypothetical protein [Alteromonas sp. BMJM2]|uniref:hypothetical protein n=1 Tax=Alteromonas sp. BMJM2 TaxID=2954241 RepID=UPI0022B50004|nr:hypothetical protein [Alteromonas sp. BMJM2]